MCVYGLTFETTDLKTSLWKADTPSEYLGQVRTSRSSGRGQGHRSEKHVGASWELKGQNKHTFKVAAAPAGCKAGPGCHLRAKSLNNGLICLLMHVTLYSTLDFEKNIFWTTVTGSNKNNAC